MKAQKPACALCPSKGTGRSFVPFEGPVDSPLLIVGQGPGEDEAYTGSPFVGKSGAMLNKWLQLAGIDRRMARVGNTVLCWMPEDPGALKGNRAPKAAEAAYCREQHWSHEVELPLLPGDSCSDVNVHAPRPRRVIVAVGVPAMKQFYGLRAGEGTAGQLAKTEDGAYLLGLIHPAAIMRGKWGMEPAQVQTLKRAKKILDGWEPIVPDFSQAPPDANLFPTLLELKEWEAQLAPDEPVSLDIEAAGRVIRLVGLCGAQTLKYVGVHFRQQGGSTWVHCPLCRGLKNTEMCRHPQDDTLGVVDWLYRLLAGERGKVFHNGFYDIEQLEETGFEVNGFSDDTILMAHCSMPEARKRLEAVSLLTTGITGWKAKLREGGGHWK